MFSKRALEGYVMIDHRESPGTESIAGRAGVPGGILFEASTISCTHCQRVYVQNPLRTRPQHYCAKCDHYICDRPECVLMAQGAVKHQTMNQLFDALIEEIQQGAAA